VEAAPIADSGELTRASRPEHSVLTEPIASVPRFFTKIGSQKMSTNRFSADIGISELQFRFFRFGSGSNREPSYLTTFTQSKEKTYRWVTFVVAALQQGTTGRRNGASACDRFEGGRRREWRRWRTLVDDELGTAADGGVDP
jgi:hypothetical protein